MQLEVITNSVVEAEEHTSLLQATSRGSNRLVASTRITDAAYSSQDYGLDDGNISNPPQRDESAAAAAAAAAANEFASSPVREDQTMAWMQVALIFVAGALSLPSLVAGMNVVASTSATSATSDDTTVVPHQEQEESVVVAARSIVGGNLLLAAVASLCGLMGAQTRLSSYALIEIAFGRRGAACINGTLAVALLGWFGVNLNLCARSLQHGVLLVQLVGGLVMTLTSMCGIRALEMLSRFLAPVLALVMGLLIYRSLEALPLSSGDLKEDINSIYQGEFAWVQMNEIHSSGTVLQLSPESSAG